MTTITVAAADSASAMEQIADQLGKDAYILDTAKENGLVRIVATNDPARARKKPVAESRKPNFAPIFEAKMLAEPPEAGLHSALHDPADRAALALAGDAADSAQPEAGGLIGLRSELRQLRQMLDGMMITSVDGLAPAHGHSLPVQLRQNGFSNQLISDLREVWQNQEAELGHRAFMQSLAVRLAAGKAEEKARARIICITGSSGSGKTMLAAKLAAWSRADTPGHPLILGSLSETQSTVPDSLSAFGRMMNLPCQQLPLDGFADSLQETSKKMIVDVSQASQAVLEVLAAARSKLGREKISFLHCLPGGTSAKMIDHQMRQVLRLHPDIALTKLDECETGPQEFSALAENHGKISVLTGTKSVLGAIAFASEAILAQYLNENC